MDERYLLTATRYVELNPVLAGLCRKPEAWKWSSSSAHMKRKDDILVRVKPMLELIEDWTDFLSVAPTKEESNLIREHERTGRPLGSIGFVEEIENRLGRTLQPNKRGPKKGLPE